MNKKNTATKKNQHAIVSDVKTQKSDSTIRVVFIAVVVVVIIGVAGWYLLYAKTLDTAKTGCSKDTALIEQYNVATSTIASQKEYERLITTINSKQNKDTDLTCQYMLFQSYLRSTNEADAKKSYGLIQQLHNNGSTIPQGLFTNMQDIQTLLNQYKQYDSTQQQPNGVG